jgi:hypothetical protein
MGSSHFRKQRHVETLNKQGSVQQALQHRVSETKNQESLDPT